MNILEDLRAMKKLPFNKLYLQEFIVNYIENYFISMFDYKNFPDSFPKEYAEKYLIWYGLAAGRKIPEEYNAGMYAGGNVVLQCNIAGGDTAENVGLDVYGLGVTAILTGMNGYNEEIPINDCAVGWNNSAHTSLRSFINITSGDIANAFLSLRSGVRYTKNHPIYKARDDKEKAALSEYWKKIDGDEEALAIASTNILDEILDEKSGNAANNVINLSDPHLADKLQYVSKVIDDYMRWGFGLYGQTIQGNGKLAQQTKDEVNGQTSLSFVLPNDMLRQRKLWVERLKALDIVGSDADIDFSTAFKVEEIKYQKEADIDSNGEIEEVKEEAPEEQKGEENNEETVL